MKIDSVVIVKSSSEVKKIVDVEIICGQKIFYMEDNTSYHENQLSSSQDVKKLLSKKLETNKEKCDEIYREMIKEMVSNSLTFIKKNQYYQT
jgi:hypothetical protein